MSFKLIVFLVLALTIASLTVICLEDTNIWVTGVVMYMFGIVDMKVLVANGKSNTEDA